MWKSSKNKDWIFSFLLNLLPISKNHLRPVWASVRVFLSFYVSTSNSFFILWHHICNTWCVVSDAKSLKWFLNNSTTENSPNEESDILGFSSIFWLFEEQQLFTKLKRTSGCASRFFWAVAFGLLLFMIKYEKLSALLVMPNLSNDSDNITMWKSKKKGIGFTRFYSIFCQFGRII